LVVLALAGGVLQLVAALAHGDRTVTSPFPDAAVDHVVVSTDNGSVRVVRDDDDPIRVRVDVADGLVATKLTQRLRGRRLLLTARCPWLGAWWCRADYTVHVPSSVEVDAGHA
jgi:hypothetical protein